MSIPAAFDYHPATSVNEAIALLQQYGDDAKLLAGGHSLIPTMKLRLAQPAHLIDIGRISGLAYIREESGAIAVGAMTTYRMIELSDVLWQHFPALRDAASVIGDQQVRNRGTIGGSIAHSHHLRYRRHLLVRQRSHYRCLRQAYPRKCSRSRARR